MPEWYDSDLHYGLENVANPANLSFGLLRTPSLNRQHIPFHLQKESCTEATIVAEKVLKNMNLVIFFGLSGLSAHSLYICNFSKSI